MEEPLLLNIPNELTEIMLFKLDTPEWGLIPLDDFIATSNKGIFGIQACSRAFYLTYNCYFYHSRKYVKFGKEITKPGDRVDLELDVGKKQMTIRVWSASFKNPSTPAGLVQTIALEDNITYCWAVSVGMPGSKCSRQGLGSQSRITTRS